MVDSPLREEEVRRGYSRRRPRLRELAIWRIHIQGPVSMGQAHGWADLVLDRTLPATRDLRQLSLAVGCWSWSHRGRAACSSAGVGTARPALVRGLAAPWHTRSLSPARLYASRSIQRPPPGGTFSPHLVQS